MTKLGQTEKELLKAAAKVFGKAHVLWGFRVGAAVLAEDGRTYEGCNVESWISGLGICAERNAINHSALHGNRQIKEVAIAMDADSHNEPRPCGACLQYICDFAESPKVKVVMAKVKNGRILFDNCSCEDSGRAVAFSLQKIGGFCQISVVKLKNEQSIS